MKWLYSGHTWRAAPAHKGGKIERETGSSRLLSVCQHKRRITVIGCALMFIRFIVRCAEYILNLHSYFSFQFSLDMLKTDLSSLTCSQRGIRGTRKVQSLMNADRGRKSCITERVFDRVYFGCCFPKDRRKFTCKYRKPVSVISSAFTSTWRI